MTVANLMSASPHTLGREHSMAAAHRLMRRHGIRHLPIVEEGKLLGMVSQRDLYFFESLTDVDSAAIQVSEAMEGGVFTVSPRAPVSEVVQVMVDNRVGSVVVVDNEKVVGIFTTIDALSVLFDLTSLEGEILSSHLA